MALCLNSSAVRRSIQFIHFILMGGRRDRDSALFLFCPSVSPQLPPLPFTVHPTTKRSPMRCPTAFFLSSVWTLLFAASLFHHVSATTASPAFFPQVRDIFPSYLVSLHSCLTRLLQGFLFDWNPPGTTIPIPTTRTVDFFSCLPVCSWEIQNSVKHCTSHGSAGLRA